MRLLRFGTVLLRFFLALLITLLASICGLLGVSLVSLDPDLIRIIIYYNIYKLLSVCLFVRSGDGEKTGLVPG